MVLLFTIEHLALAKNDGPKSSTAFAENIVENLTELWADRLGLKVHRFASEFSWFSPTQLNVFNRSKKLLSKVFKLLVNIFTGQSTVIYELLVISKKNINHVRTLRGTTKLLHTCYFSCSNLKRSEILLIV